MCRLVMNERDYRAIRIFKVVASCGGFSAAENVLNMTTATISRHIKELEDKLGTTLCTRGPQGFALTESGRVALSRIHEALDAVDSIFPAIDDARSVLSGELRIGVIDNIIANPLCHLHSALERLHKEAPQVEIDLSTVSGHEILKQLMNHHYHVVITGAFFELPSLKYRYLFDEIQQIYIRKDAEPGHDLPLIYNPAQVSTNAIANKQGIRSNFKKGPNAHGLQSVAFLIATGEFSGMLPMHFADQISAHYHLKPLEDSAQCVIPCYAVTNPARPLPLCAERFIQIMEAFHTPS